MWVWGKEKGLFFCSTFGCPLESGNGKWWKDRAKTMWLQVHRGQSNCDQEMLGSEPMRDRSFVFGTMQWLGGWWENLMFVLRRTERKGGNRCPTCMMWAVMVEERHLSLALRQPPSCCVVIEHGAFFRSAARLEQSNTRKTWLITINRRVQWS